MANMVGTGLNAAVSAGTGLINGVMQAGTGLLSAGINMGEPMNLIFYIRTYFP